MKNIQSIILARGGSKGIPGKNIIDFCGKPLIVWTIEQLQETEGIGSIWVSSDSEEILFISQGAGAEIIKRPSEISGDTASSEAGWIHALDIIEKKTGSVDIVVAPQVTSPLRESKDIENGLKNFHKQECDSMFSCCKSGDLYLWRISSSGVPESINYDYKNRKRRQELNEEYIENGSFYLFKPEIIRKNKNRFGGKIGMVEMEFWKMFEIDTTEDLKICEVLMKAFLLNERDRG
jgi:CMP-N,N'-diacetyllegionaminic acid synthase